MGGSLQERTGTAPPVSADGTLQSAGAGWMRVAIVVAFLVAVVLILASQDTGVLP